MAGPERVLVVCTGNICRSPYGEAWLNARAGREGHPLVAISRGLGAVTGGTAPPLAVEIAAARGLDLKPHRGRQLTGTDLAWADEALVMEPWQEEELLGLLGTGGAWADREPPRVTGLWRHLPGGGEEIPDPYGGGREHFERSSDLLDRALAGWWADRYGPGDASTARS